MVRIVAIPSISELRPPRSAAPIPLERGWRCSELARWVAGEGYRLLPRDCGGGEWAVIADKPGDAASVVATGFSERTVAWRWIRDEIPFSPSIGSERR